MARNRRSRPSIPIQQRVHLFLRLYAEMKKEPYAQATEISITFSSGSAGTATSTNTPRQDFRSYLVSFRQLISPDDPVYLPTILRALPRHIHDAGLRERLGKAMDGWKAANGIPSPLAPLSLGRFATGSQTARLYLYGGVFHSDPELSDIWDSCGPDNQQFIEYQFRQYEGRIREVFIELKKVIDEGRAAGVLKDDPLNLEGGHWRTRATGNVSQS